MSDHDDVLTSLDLLIDEERTALLAGNLDLLPDLLLRKEAIIFRLTEEQVQSSESLASLHMKAARNQILLDHALAGIRDVARRMKDMRSAERTLQTYDMLGQKHQISARPASSLEKRA